MSVTLPLRHGPVEIRKAAEIAEVRFPERLIEVVAVPYEEEAEVLYRGRMITESFARGAFEGVQMRARQFAVNRAHDMERPVGKVRRFRPRDAAGLVAEIETVRTQAGDETLELAAEGLLGASVGFGVLGGIGEGEVWTRDGRARRILKAWLDHLAMTGDPSYLGAKVLAVRARDVEVVAPATSATPNLDQVRAWRLEERYSRLTP